MKRKRLTNDIVVSKEGDETTRFSLSGYEAKLGVDVKNAKGVDLLAGDDVIEEQLRNLDEARNDVEHRNRT